MITGNTSQRGGGIYCKYCFPLIANCTIAGNTATGDQGGGIFGGGLVYGCTITGNQTAHPLGGGGVAGYGAGYYVYVHNSILWADQPDEAYYALITYSDVQGGWTGSGNIDTDPSFVDPAGGDYHLQAGSPCIDAGDPAYLPLPGEVDFDGQRRIWDGDGDGQPRVDMGADEFGSFAYGDLNCDGAVDFGDINPFVLTLTDPAAYEAQYPTCDLLNADLKSDGVVDFADINPFVALLTGQG